MGGRGEGWLAGQIVLLLAVAFAPAWPAVQLSPVVRVAGVPLLVLGGSLAVAGLAWLGPNLTPFPRPLSDNRLVTSGPYAWMRHPIYVGLLLGSLGWALLRASVAGGVLVLVLAVYLDRKAAREERWLAEKHPEYAAYAARVKRFVPGVW